MNSGKSNLVAAAVFLVIWTNAACLRTGSEVRQNNKTAPLPAKSNENQASPVNNSATPTEKLTTSKKDKNSEGDLSCSPETLKPGDILTLTMKTPHGGYLEIVTPAKKYVFLSEQDGDKLIDDAQKSGAKPFYQASELAKLNELSLDTRNASTVNYEKNAAEGKYATEKIFSAAGKYKILLSEDSFELDDPTISGKCEVDFTN